MQITKKDILLAGLALSFLNMGQAQADSIIPEGAAQRKEAIHRSLLECYSNLRRPEAEQEYAVLVGLKPSDAVLRYNYGVFLQRAGKIAPALVQYKKAVALDPSNVDFRGLLGQLLLFNKDYNGAYNELGRVVQMHGGEKYKAAFENAVRYKQQADQLRQNAASKKPTAATSRPKASEDDEDE
jgi:thioredoxin-like negative regulator of GroEL